MIRNVFFSTIFGALLVFGAMALPTSARADVATDIATILADATLTVEEIAAQVAELVTNAADPSDAAAVILAAAAGASDTQLEGIGIGLGNAVLALQDSDPTEASEVALEVAGAPAAIQTAFEATTGSTASVLAGGRGDSLLGGDRGDKSPD